jgi:hypothetical protein
MLAEMVMALWIAEAGAPAAPAGSTGQPAQVEHAPNPDGGAILPSGTPKATTPAVRDATPSGGLPDNKPTDNAPMPPPPDKTTAPRNSRPDNLPPVVPPDHAATPRDQPDQDQSDVAPSSAPSNLLSPDQAPAEDRSSQSGGGANRANAIRSPIGSDPDPLHTP